MDCIVSGKTCVEAYTPVLHDVTLSGNGAITDEMQSPRSKWPLIQEVVLCDS